MVIHVYDINVTRKNKRGMEFSLFFKLKKKSKSLTLFLKLKKCL